MGRVRYNYTLASASTLQETLSSLNRYQDKIIAVTQDGNYYTIFYEDEGNQKEADNNG